MKETIYDLLASLRFTDAPNKSISIGVPPSQQMTGISYYVDIVGCGAHPYESALLRVEALHRLTGDDRVLPIAISDVEEGIALCRQFCIELDLPFTVDDEAALRLNGKDEDRLLLYIIEKPC